MDGDDLEGRYQILTNVKRIQLGIQGIRYKKPEIYRSPKLLFREAGVGITVYLDEDRNLYCPRSVYTYHLKPFQLDDEQVFVIDYRYVLGV